MRLGCGVVQDSRVSSAIVVLEDGTFAVGHPTFQLDRATPQLIIGIIRERLTHDDFATRPVRSAIRMRLREMEGKSPREQLKTLGKLLQEYAEYLLVEAGTDMDDAMRKKEEKLDAGCEWKAA